MSKRWSMVLTVLVAGLLIASSNAVAAKTDSTANPNQYDDELLYPEVQLELERLENRLSKQINEKDLENYEKIMDAKMKAIDDKFDDYKWFGALFITLLGVVLTLGGVAFIEYMVTKRIDLKMEKILDEKVQNRVNDLNNIIESNIKSYTRDVADLKQRAEKELRLKLKEIKNIRPEEMTTKHKEIIKEAVDEIKKKPEETYSAEDYFLQGVEAHEGGKFEKAIEYTQKAIKMKPDFTLAHRNLGRVYNKAGKIDQALKANNKAIQLDPSYSNAYYGQACNYSLKKDKVNALKYLEIATDKGWAKLNHMEKDRDLDFIRHTSEYKRIIKKLKEQAEPVS